MKMLSKTVLLLIAMLLTSVVVTASLEKRNRVETGLTSAGAPVPTETLFKQKCQKCHGADGDGDTSLGRIFGTPDFTDSGWWTKHSNNAELVGVITRGKKNMPAFGRKLTRAQITGLASYVQHFRR